MTKQVIERAPARNVVQISLPKAFGDELRAQADLQGRSMAAQLEHWARIAMAIETLGPSPAIVGVKSMPLNDAAALRAAFTRFLLGPSLDSTTAQLAAANLPSYGKSPSTPGATLRIAPDGTRTEGHIDAQGNFIPMQPSAETQHHVHQKKEAQAVRKRSSAPTKKRVGATARRAALPIAVPA